MRPGEEILGGDCWKQLGCSEQDVKHGWHLRYCSLTKVVARSWIKAGCATASQFAGHAINGRDNSCEGWLGVHLVAGGCRCEGHVAGLLSVTRGAGETPSWTTKWTAQWTSHSALHTSQHLDKLACQGPAIPLPTNQIVSLINNKFL